MTRKT